jgi:hypothetical protein
MAILPPVDIDFLCNTLFGRRQSFETLRQFGRLWSRLADNGSRSMQPSTSQNDIVRSIAALKAAFVKGNLKRHPSSEVVGLVGREVLASWGSAMRR